RRCSLRTAPANTSWKLAVGSWQFSGACALPDVHRGSGGHLQRGAAAARRRGRSRHREIGRAACAPPARMKLPSWTARTRTAAGLNVIVNDSPDSRDAFVAEMATVYGPPPTRNSGPGGVMTTCAPAGAIVGGGAVAAAGAAGTGAGVVGEGAGTGAPEAAPPGSAAAPGTAGVGAAVTAVVPGTGELPGGMIDTPGAVAAPTGAGVGTTGGAGAATGAPKAGSGSSGAAISGGGPFRPRFCCVPM